MARIHRTVRPPIANPVLRALDKLPDASWGRIFGVSRQSVAQWRKYESIPRHYMRAFAVNTGVTIEEQLECEELAKGIVFADFLKAAHVRFESESKRKAR